MTPTQMEHLSPPVEQAPPPAPEPYSPPPAARRFRPSSSWRKFYEGRERRLWTASLVGALLVAVAGIGVLYLDDTSNQATIRSLTTQNESLTGRNQNLNDQLKTTQANLTATLGELAQTKADLAHPHLTIWNVPQELKGASWYLAGGVPDTFTYHLQATSTGPMSVSILTFEQWAKAIQCIDNGVGTTNYCMHHSGAVISFLNVTNVNYDFHLSEGCADYLSVFTSGSTVTVTPNVSVTYNPATSPTGVCS
jgi:cell division protein FtsB